MTRHDFQKKLPLVSIGIGAAACLIALDPSVGQALAFDRVAIGQGEFYRLLTGHLVHWNRDHLFWDVLMFVVLSGMLELRSRFALCLTLVASAAAISASIWTAQPNVDVYRGLSGIDSALFTAVALTIWFDARARRDLLLANAALATLAALLAKIGWELATGTTLFVDSASAGFTPLPLVHLVGGVIGLAIAWYMNHRHRASAGTAGSPLTRCQSL